jgi:hypothetical protein
VREVSGISRAAWLRIKARVAEPRTVTIFKGRSCGPTMGLLEQWADLYDVAVHPDETDAEFRERVRRRYQTLTIDTRAEESQAGRFSVEQLFEESDQVTRVIGRICR